VLKLSPVVWASRALFFKELYNPFLCCQINTDISFVSSKATLTGGSLEEYFFPASS